MHDVHCHLDQHGQPEEFAQKLEAQRIFTIAITNLPSHYALALPRLNRFSFVKPALGLHPLLSNKHRDEFLAFEKLARSADFIGEVGLDFSVEGISTKDEQIASFRRILDCLKRRKRVISLHSRKAENEVLSELTAFKIGPAIFHWFTGPAAVCVKIASQGHFFSVNSAMLASEKGLSIVRQIPRDRILTESDFPHVRLHGKVSTPLQMNVVAQNLAKLWRIDFAEVELILAKNLKQLLQYSGLMTP